MPPSPGSTTVSYRSGNTNIPVGLFLPASGRSDTLVILAYGSDGLVNNNHGSWKTMIEKFAEELAQRGLAAAIPDFFASTGTRPGDLDPGRPGAYLDQILAKRGDWLVALRDGMNELSNPAVIPGVNPARVGLLGFSLGGYLCAQLAQRAKAMVLFYAPWMDGVRVSGPLSTKVEMHHGEQDPLLPYSSNAVLIQKALETAGASVQLWPAYPGANHGFVGNDTANQKAHDLSQQRTLDFFQANL